MGEAGEVLVPGNIWRESEFVGGLTGACGPNALAMAESWAEQRYVATLVVYTRMRAAGRCEPNGPTTIGGIAAQAAADGFQTALVPFAEPMAQAQWRDFLQAHSATHAVVLELANGQALHDSISGQGENARNLKYHFMVVVGRNAGGASARAGRDLPAGWWCADGDNFAPGDVLQYYTDAVLAAAQPCAAMAVAAHAPTGQGGGAMAGQATGYFGLVTTDDPQVWLCAETGKHLGHAFRDHYAGLRVTVDPAGTGTNILGLPVSEEYAWNGVTRQDFERGSLIYDTQHARDPWTVYHAKLHEELLAAQADAANTRAQLAAAQERQASDSRAQQLLQALRAALG